MSRRDGAARCCPHRARRGQPVHRERARARRPHPRHPFGRRGQFHGKPSHLGDSPAARAFSRASRRGTFALRVPAADVFQQPHRRPVHLGRLLGRKVRRRAYDDCTSGRVVEVILWKIQKKKRKNIQKIH